VNIYMLRLIYLLFAVILVLLCKTNMMLDYLNGTIDVVYFVRQI